MIEELHKIGELDSTCLPERPERVIPENDNGPKKVPPETFDKQVLIVSYQMHLISFFSL